MKEKKDVNELSEFAGASISATLKERLAQAAHDLDLSKAQVIRRALVAFLATLETEKNRAGDDSNEN